MASSEQDWIRVIGEHPGSVYLRLFHEMARAHAGKLFLVGGCVRDALLGRPLGDFDLLFTGDLSGFLKDVSTGRGLTLVPLDPGRGIFRLVVKREENLCFDFAACKEKTLEADLRGRDFTVNAIAFDLEALLQGGMALRDPLGGVADLEAGRIRSPGLHVMRADPVRVMRAFRFAATLEAKIEDETRGYLVKVAPHLRGAAPERIRDEFFKILSVRRAHPWLLEMDAAGVLEVIFPESSAMRQTEQDDRFHKDNVWGHSLETVRCLEATLAAHGTMEGFMAAERRWDAWLKFVSLFHDIGKPATQTVDERRNIHFRGHEEAGETRMRDLCTRFRLSAREKNAARLLVRLHLRPAQLSREKKISPAAIARLVRDASPYARELFLLSLADTLAKGKPSSSTVAFIERLLVDQKATNR